MSIDYYLNKIRALKAKAKGDAKVFGSDDETILAGESRVPAYVPQVIDRSKRHVDWSDPVPEVGAYVRHPNYGDCPVVSADDCSIVVKLTGDRKSQREMVSARTTKSLDGSLTHVGTRSNLTMRQGNTVALSTEVFRVGEPLYLPEEERTVYPLFRR